MKNLAYDYLVQKWISRDEAANLRKEQIKTELDLLRSPKGDDYARFVGIRNKQAHIAKLEREMAA